MYQVSYLKKTRTFYNKFIIAQKRSNVNIKIEALSDTLIHTIQFDKLGLRTLVTGTEYAKFEPHLMNFNEWHQSIEKIDKEVKEVEIFAQDDKFIMNGENIPSEKRPCNNISWKNFMTINAEALNNAICINSVCANNGKLNCNKKIFFCLNNEKLKIINTNDIILHESCIFNVNTEKEFIFAINNEYSSYIKKWLIFVNNYCMDLTVSQFKNFLRFQGKTENIIYEMILPIEISEENDKIYHSLNKLINKQWIGRKVELDDSDMYQVAVEETIATILASNKKVPKRVIKKELEDFTKNPDKIDAFKKLDTKTIDVKFLSLSKSVGDENIYILRTLYQNYISSISEFDYLIYYLNTKANALIFGHNDDMFSFKTLFMLRKPKIAIVEISDEDLEKLEEDSIEIYDEEIFEPT